MVCRHLIAYELSTVEIKAVHRAVRATLPDAASARIDGLPAGDADGDVVVCGTVTTEGEAQSFIGLLFSEGSRANVEVMPTAGRPDDADIIRVSCHARGVPLP